VPECSHHEAIMVRIHHLEESVGGIVKAAWISMGAVVLQLLILLGQVLIK